MTARTPRWGNTAGSDKMSRTAGLRAYNAGAAAEISVSKTYVERGATVLAHRWRGLAGEIDLIVHEDSEIVFVEVKKATSFASAAGRLGRPQMTRIHQTAAEFADAEAFGALTPMRFDLALVDQTGQVLIQEGAFSHF